jgi:arsenite-transporting ATPase
MDSSRFLFFSGKGGVGKTSMAASTAVQEAERGRKTLIVTTDPASNLADVFETEIGHRIAPIPGAPNLWAMEIDPDQATIEYKEKILGPMRGIFPSDVIAVVEEQFNSPCTTEIAAFDRFVKFMDNPEFDLVIFDTAPTGHTIRLLELPVNWSDFIDLSAKGSGQTCLGPVQAIQESKAIYDKAIAELRNPEATTFIFVVQPEAVAIGETERSVAEIRQLGVKSIELIINGILPEEVCEDPFFRSRWEMQQRHLQEIGRRLDLPTRRMFLQDEEIKGIEKLRRTGQMLMEETALNERGNHDRVSA